MDRFIVSLGHLYYTTNSDLKSNMDRFIVNYTVNARLNLTNLKSNMDRFIALAPLLEITETTDI